MMRIEDRSPLYETGLVNGWSMTGPMDDDLPSAIRHPAFASQELAHTGSLSASELARYEAAETRLRAWADLAPIEAFAALAQANLPVVETATGADVPLTTLLIEAWMGRHLPLPVRAIDHEMVEAAKELLRDLAWRLPN